MTEANLDEDSIQFLSDVEIAHQLRKRTLEHLLVHISKLRQQCRGDCDQFLQKIKPIVETARKNQRAYERQDAQKFNALSYLRNDEIGLSKIIADLLDPASEHSQGAVFLEAMLNLLSVSRESSDTDRLYVEKTRLPGLDEISNIRVQTERSTNTGRQIDISVDFVIDHDLPYCLAFENKPYNATDQPDQCKDYLEFLNREYSGHFRLIYLPSQERMPSKSSLPDPDAWEGRFYVMPYAPTRNSFSSSTDSDEVDTAGIDIPVQLNERDTEHSSSKVPSKFIIDKDTSLANWFGTCCDLSEAERLRWFLSEAQRYCQKFSGESNLTDTAAHDVKEHLKRHPEQASSAYTVYRAWPNYIKEVGERFLLHLTAKIQCELSNNGYEVRMQNQFQEEKESYLAIYKIGWLQYAKNERNHLSATRTTIRLYLYWDLTETYWGVFRGKKKTNKMTKQESNLHQKLEEGLGKIGLDQSDLYWVYWDTPKYDNLAVVAGELDKELRSGEGEIISYFINWLLEFVEKATVIIDSIESERANSKS